MPPRCAFGLLPPEGALFCLGAARRQKDAPTLRLWLAAPRGGAFCLGAARRQKDAPTLRFRLAARRGFIALRRPDSKTPCRGRVCKEAGSCVGRSEEHTSELQSLMRISYAVVCLKKTKYQTPQI